MSDYLKHIIIMLNALMYTAYSLELCVMFLKALCLSAPLGNDHWLANVDNDHKAGFCVSRMLPDGITHVTFQKRQG